MSLSAVARTLGSSSSPWSSGFPGKVYTDIQCPDIGNTGPNNTAATCQALCDSTPRCNAINSKTGGGPCALRACSCPVPLPAGTLSQFTAYRRLDNPCPPQFANVFTSSMVLQREPLQSRLFGTAAPNASLLVAVVKGEKGWKGPRTVKQPPYLSDFPGCTSYLGNRLETRAYREVSRHQRRRGEERR